MSTTKASRQRNQRILNSTQLRILETAAIVRYGTVEDYTQMHFSRGSLTWWRTVLSRLSGSGDWQTTGYMVRFPIPTARGNSTRLYALSYRGAKYLRQNGSRADWWYRPYRMRNQAFSYLAHQLACTRLYISAVLFCRRHAGYQLAEALTAYDLAADPPTTTLEINGRKTPSPSFLMSGCAWSMKRTYHTSTVVSGLKLTRGSEHRSRWEHPASRTDHLSETGVQGILSDCRVRRRDVEIGQPAYRASRLRQLRAWTATLLAKEGLTRSGHRFSSLQPLIWTASTFPQTLLRRRSGSWPMSHPHRSWWTPPRQRIPPHWRREENCNGPTSLA